MMRLVDFMYGLPNIILVILLQVYFKAVARREATGFAGALVQLDSAMGGLFFIFIVLGAFNWIGMARLARGQVLATRKMEFVDAARAVGAGPGRIILRHIMPNILGPCIVAETMAIPGYIFFEAFLSFIGLGVNPPTPSWGAMINQGYQGLRSNPHLIIAPSIGLTVTVLAFNFFGDGLRDAFDPSLRGVVGARTPMDKKAKAAARRRRLILGAVAAVIVVAAGLWFALPRGDGAQQVDSDAGSSSEVEEAPTTYVTEHGHEVTLPEVSYDTPKTGEVTSSSPIPSVFETPAGISMLGIIGRNTEVDVLGESTNEQGELFLLIKGFGLEGWMAAEDITVE
jgi:ABC-type methionine transport system permease subunit